MEDIYKKTNCCAACNNTALKEILDLHDVPLAGFYPKKPQIHKQCIYPLKLIEIKDKKKGEPKPSR